MKNLHLQKALVCFIIMVMPYFAYSQCASAQGDETSYGDNYWIGYVYSVKNNFTTPNYVGYVRELATFNESFCGNTCTYATNGCSITTDNFSIRYKMNMAFACGDYTFTIGGDDGVRLYIDGALVINDYTDHGYRTTSATVTLTEAVHSFVLEYYENASVNQVSFSYVNAAGNSNGPGVVASSQAFCQNAPFDPTLFTSTSTAAFCAGAAPTYQWQQSTDQYSWSDIAGETNTTYDVPSNSTLGAKYYRRAAYNGALTIYSNTLTVLEETPTGDYTVYGNGVWNAYIFNSTTYGTNYWGYYTENNVSFTSGSRWTPTSGPSTANSTSGSVYAGCAGMGSTNYIVSYKRTNFTCGYYQIDIPYHDDNVALYIDEVLAFQHVGWGDGHTNTWTGFLGPTSKVEARVTNFTGPGELRVTISASPTNPLNVNTPVTVCPTYSAVLTASSSITGATYSWAPDASNSTSTIAAPSNAASVTITPTASGNYTATLTDAATTGCTITNTVPVTSNATATTALTVTPATYTTNCPNSTYTFVVQGAASYIWSADTGTGGGLSAATGYKVTANPQQTTVYTVVGNTGCNTLSQQVTITVNVPVMSTFPSNTWNVYGYNSQTIAASNYVGYYTEDGSTTSPNTYSFDTRNRFASGAAPSTANTSSGLGWTGCTINATNIALSFKRTGFACGIYKLDVPAHDDDFYLFINGVQVAQHVGYGDSHTNVWTGALDANSQVEWQLKQGSGNSYLSVTFTNITQPATQTTWVGNVSGDWSNASNWCGGVPSLTTDVLIPAAGPKYMPTITTAGTQVQNIVINAGSAVSTYSAAIAAASLTTSGSNNLDVYGNWTNNGTYTSNSGSISFVGTTSATISSSATETFYKLVVNKTSNATLTLSSGAQRISSNMTFTSGIVIPTSTLTFLDGTSASSVSDASYVQGAVTKTGINSFDFPIGKNGRYRPISISSLAATTDSYTAQYFQADPNPSYNRSSKDAALNHVGQDEYWTMTKVSGTNAKVTLSWLAGKYGTSGGVNDLPNLRVTGWNGTTWKDLGNGGTTGTTAAGTIITTATTNTFNAFTLASANANNPLPISLSSFTCALVNGAVDLNWSTLSEMNNDYFYIERANGNNDFTELSDHIKGAGTTEASHTYQTFDNNIPSGQLYYRLNQVDFDGKTTHSNVCTVINNGNDLGIGVYPNPADEVINVRMNGRSFQKYEVISSLGTLQKTSFDGTNQQITIHTRDLEDGVYFLKIYANSTVTITKISITHGDGLTSMR